MATNSAAGLLTSVDSMFTTQEERDNAQRSYVMDLPTTEISDFPNHPFKVRMGESMTEMVESVKERGVLSPVLVQPMPDGSYQMVSGHRRRMAAELAGLPTVPCIVRELTDDEAIIIMVDSNLQREQVLPSEKAFAYRMKVYAFCLLYPVWLSPVGVFRAFSPFLLRFFGPVLALAGGVRGKNGGMTARKKREA